MSKTARTTIVVGAVSNLRKHRTATTSRTTTVDRAVLHIHFPYNWTTPTTIVVRAVSDIREIWAKQLERQLSFELSHSSYWTARTTIVVGAVVAVHCQHKFETARTTIVDRAVLRCELRPCSSIENCRSSCSSHICLSRGFVSADTLYTRYG